MQGAAPVGAGLGIYMKASSLALQHSMRTCLLAHAAPYSDYRDRGRRCIFTEHEYIIVAVIILCCSLANIIIK